MYHLNSVRIDTVRVTFMLIFQYISVFNLDCFLRKHVN